MSETKYFGELAVEEGDDRFETFEAVADVQNNNIHHIRVSAKLDDGELSAIAVQPFKDESTPMWNKGCQFQPESLDDVINGLEMIRLEYMG